jgi:hypothetical protein
MAQIFDSADWENIELAVMDYLSRQPRPKLLDYLKMKLDALGIPEDGDERQQIIGAMRVTAARIVATTGDPQNKRA